MTLKNSKLFNLSLDKLKKLDLYKELYRDKYSFEYLSNIDKYISTHLNAENKIKWNCNIERLNLLEKKLNSGDSSKEDTSIDLDFISKLNAKTEVDILNLKKNLSYIEQERTKTISTNSYLSSLNHLGTVLPNININSKFDNDTVFLSSKGIFLIEFKHASGDITINSSCIATSNTWNNKTLNLKQRIPSKREMLEDLIATDLNLDKHFSIAPLVTFTGDSVRIINNNSPLNIISIANFKDYLYYYKNTYTLNEIEINELKEFITSKNTNLDLYSLNISNLIESLNFLKFLDDYILTLEESLCSLKKEKKLNQKKIFKISSILLVVFLGFFLIGGAFFKNKERKDSISKSTIVLNEKDGDLKPFLISPLKNYEVLGLRNLINSDENLRKTLINHLGESGKIEPVSGLIFYGDGRLKCTPSEVSLTFSKPVDTVLINDIEDKSNINLNLTPGIYDIQFFNSNLGIKSKTIKVNTTSKKDINIDLKNEKGLKPETVKIKSEINNGTIYIDGIKRCSIDKSGTTSIENVFVGDSSIKIKYNFPWGSETTPESTISSKDFYFEYLLEGKSPGFKKFIQNFIDNELRLLKDGTYEKLYSIDFFIDTFKIEKEKNNTVTTLIYRVSSKDPISDEEVENAYYATSTWKDSKIVDTVISNYHGPLNVAYKLKHKFSEPG